MTIISVDRQGPVERYVTVQLSELELRDITNALVVAGDGIISANWLYDRAKARNMWAVLYPLFELVRYGTVKNEPFPEALGGDGDGI